MRIAFGLKAHSGWAALVALGKRDRELEVVDRCRVELVETDEAPWAKHPYHAAQRSKKGDAEELVQRGIQSARRNALRELRAAVRRIRTAQHEVAACTVLTANPLPDWSVSEILAVHFRMHKAEGMLFREALARAAGACGLTVVAIPEKLLDEHATKKLGTPVSGVRKKIATLGKTVGPPWGKDQKDAALAALIALSGQSK